MPLIGATKLKELSADDVDEWLDGLTGKLSPAGSLAFVGDAGFEPATSSVSTRRAPTAPIALEAEAGIEPAYRALQALA